MAPHLVRAHSTYNIWICSFHHPPPTPPPSQSLQIHAPLVMGRHNEKEKHETNTHSTNTCTTGWHNEREKKTHTQKTHARSVCSRQNFDVMNREHRCATAPSPTLTIVLFRPTLRLWRQNADSVSRSWFGRDIGHFLCQGRGVSGG